MENLDFQIENEWLKKYTGSESMVTVPDSVPNICFSAFLNSSISHIILPQSVGYLGSNAFEGCKNLKTVEIRNPNMEFGSNPFKNAASNFEILFNGTCDQFEKRANRVYCYRGEYQSGDYHHPTATGFEYYKYIVYEHIFSDTLSTPFTCKVKCTDGELVYHEMPKKTWTERI